MNWKALKDGLCPKCGKALKDSGLWLDSIPALRCPDKSCDFKISESRFKKIFAPKTKSTAYQSEDERLSELNNYGRNKVSEDFSDSPHLNY